MTTTKAESSAESSERLEVRRLRPVPEGFDLDGLTAEAGEIVRTLQRQICAAIERVDGQAKFQLDSWQRAGGGGGLTGILSDGAVFEKAGVNTSVVHGELTKEMQSALPGDGPSFFATGVSLVLHPQNPYVPTTHANFRFLRRGRTAWFGGGADLTPYYPFLNDAAHFHRQLAAACNRHDPDFYRRFKAWCDEYFYLRHRQETRGVGGIFFDYLPADLPSVLPFWKDAGAAFLPAYLPIVERRKDTPFGERQRRFQLYRRGRYVEFNLLYDRGTVFGLRTDGRVESILMSLPPLVRWDYDVRPEPGSEEAQLADFLRPRDYLAEAGA
jgi:coproporphyrinogen III oxidase